MSSSSEYGARGEIPEIPKEPATRTLDEDDKEGEGGDKECEGEGKWTGEEAATGDGVRGGGDDDDDDEDEITIVPLVDTKSTVTSLPTVTSTSISADDVGE